MPPRRHLTIEERARAIGWLDDGVSLREASRRLNVSPSVIHRLSQRFSETHTVHGRPRSGRPRVTTPAEDRYILISALRNRTVTANSLRRTLRAATHTNVSDQTVRNRLRARNLRPRRQAVRPVLLPRHRTARLDWARQHIRWTRQQWSSVVFTDESRFTLQNNDGRILVYRRPGERFSDATVRQHNQFGGGSIMVWAGFSYHQRTPLHVIDGNLTGLRYRDEILRPIVLPCLQRIGGAAVLQDDNARPHRARVVTDFLRQHNITRMDWPAYSPDMAPIEHLWDQLGLRLMGNHPPPVDLRQLTQWLIQEWQAIPQRSLQRLVTSMRRRCVACVTARGGHTRY